MRPIALSDLEDLMRKSRDFAQKNKFGCDTTKCEELLKLNFNDDELLANANSAYAVIHHKVLDLMKKFIKLKQKSGSSVEKLIYKVEVLPTILPLSL